MDVLRVSSQEGGNDAPSSSGLQVTEGGNCTRGPNWTLFIHCCIPPSVLIVIILSFVGKMYDYRLRSLFGIKRLAVVYPINLLDDHKNRWSHAIAFGATASTFFVMFNGRFVELYINSDNSLPSYVTILLAATATIELGIILYPFFACISSPSRFVGNILGFLYSAVWFSVQLSHFILCPNIEGAWGEEGFLFEEFIIQLPVLVFTFLLMNRFLYYFVDAIIKKIKKEKISVAERLRQSYQAQHVRALLRPPPPPIVFKNRWEKMKHYFYKPSEPFIYPTGFVCTFVLAVICEYQIICVITTTIFFNNVIIMPLPSAKRRYFAVTGRKMEHDLSICRTVRIAIRLIYAFDQIFEGLFATVRVWFAGYVAGAGIPPDAANATYLLLTRYESAAHISWYVASALSIVISLCYIPHIFLCFRKHILRLYRGDRKFLPHRPQNSTRIMGGSLRYCGYQVAYFLSGYFVMTFVTFVLVYSFSVGLIIPIIDDAGTYMKGALSVILPLLAVVFVVFGSQPILAKRVFLQPKLHDEDKDKPLALQYRDFYHIFSYFLIFLNMVIGVFSCVLRISKSMVIGMFLLCRIDRPILMRGYEHLDQSYQAYVGHLKMINAHSHPVLVVFCQILVNRIISRKRAKLTTDAAASYGFVEHENESITPHARATMRWKLAYTLLFNPNLLGTRKQSRQMTFKDMEKRILLVAGLLPHRQQVLTRSRRRGDRLFLGDSDQSDSEEDNQWEDSEIEVPGGDLQSDHAPIMQNGAPPVEESINAHADDTTNLTSANGEDGLIVHIATGNGDSRDPQELKDFSHC